MLGVGFQVEGTGGERTRKQAGAWLLSEQRLEPCLDVTAGGREAALMAAGGSRPGTRLSVPHGAPSPPQTAARRAGAQSGS